MSIKFKNLFLLSGAITVCAAGNTQVDVLMLKVKFKCMSPLKSKYVISTLCTTYEAPITEL